MSPASTGRRAVGVVSHWIIVRVENWRSIHVSVEVVFDEIQHLGFQGLLLLPAGHGYADCERIFAHEGRVRDGAFAASAPTPGLFDEARDVHKIGRGALAEVLFAEGGVRVLPIA